eukprot:994609-Pelagomonas_calceolata.AAC.3
MVQSPGRFACRFEAPSSMLDARQADSCHLIWQASCQPMSTCNSAALCRQPHPKEKKQYLWAAKFLPVSNREKRIPGTEVPCVLSNKRG